MASDTLTPFLGLVKPVVGDPDGEDEWGVKLNVNFDLLDSFASKQGALVEAPQNGKVYGRGTPENWQEVPLKTDFDDLATAVGQNDAAITNIENVNATQDTAIAGKAPLGPSDGKTYGWKGTTWFDITTSLSVDWGNITGKPATFPPTLPIPSSGVTGLDAKQASQDTAIAAINWNSLSGKPATFPPSLPIPSSGVTGLDAAQTTQDSRLTAVESKNTSQDSAIAANVTALDTKEPIIAAGNAAYFWAGDKTWKPVPAAGIAEAPVDGQLYSRKGSNASWVVASAGAVVSDTPPAGTPISTIWWNSSNGGLFINYLDPSGPPSQWVMVNAAGMPEAPKDAKPYARQNGAWFDLTASFAAKADRSYVDTQLAGYVPRVGDTTITGSFATSNALTCGTFMTVQGQYLSLNNGYISAINNGYGAQYGIAASGAAQIGGVLGYSAGNNYYGIVGYTASGYSFFGSGRMYGSEEIHANSYLRSLAQTAILVGHPVNTSTANCQISTGGVVARTTSSSLYKTAVEPLDDVYGDKILALKPIFYRPTGTSDPEGWSRFGFSAEDCHAVDCRFAASDRKVARDANGKVTLEKKPFPVPNPEHLAWTVLPHEEREKTAPPAPTIMEERNTGEVVYIEGELEQTGHDLNGIVAALVNLVQRQDARIAALEAARGV